MVRNQKIKNQVISVLMVWLSMGITTAIAQELTEKEIILADSLEFDHDILKSVRLNTSEELKGVPKDSLHEYPALALNLERDIASKLVEELGRIKYQLIFKGYIVFKSVSSDDGETDEVQIVKHNDLLYPIIYMGTQGSFPKLSNEQIFDKIERWHGRKGCVVIGAGANWLEVKFVLPIEDTDELAKEMIDFCPALDFVYRGAERLSEKLKENKPKILLEW